MKSKNKAVNPVSQGSAGEVDRGSGVTIERQIEELKAAGWVKRSASCWASPGGALFLGPHGAWEAMCRHANGVSTDRPVPVAIQRLLDEVRAGDNGPSGHDRCHNRHNRSMSAVQSPANPQERKPDESSKGGTS